MSDTGGADEIRAAGALLWRPSDGETEVALIHRPKYDDWSFAKGKLEPGEHALLAARREVREETGLRITLGRRLPTVGYKFNGVPKTVEYWAAEAPAPGGEFAANKEVDTLKWVLASRAERRLSYQHDKELLADFMAGPSRTVPVILVRHASAGAKSDSRKDDQARKLDARGDQQASTLAELLACFGAARVLSSPAERCLATVRPYAQRMGRQIEVEPALAVPDASAKKSVRLAVTHALERIAASAAADAKPVVICAHRENLPLILAAACEQLKSDIPAGPPLRKGGFVVLHHADGQLVVAEQHHPEDMA